MLYRYYDGLPTDGYEWFYAPGTAAGLIPTNAGQTCAFVSTTPVADARSCAGAGPRRPSPTLLHLAGGPLADRILDARPAGRLHGWAGHPGYLRQAHGPGWALVGDAGYFKDPITTHGMTDALRDAQLLADAVVAASSGQSLEQVAMARYQATRDRLSHRLFEATEAVAAYDWDTPTIQRLLREVSASMSDELDHLNGLLRTGRLLRRRGRDRSRHARRGVGSVAATARGTSGRPEGAAMSVQVRLLGGFEVVRDGVPVAAEAWVRRQAAQLVQLLALSRDRRLHREQVVDALWPGLSWDAAGPRLHKAAHYARRALDDPGAVVLRQELVVALPRPRRRRGRRPRVRPGRRPGPAERRPGARRRGPELVRRPLAARRPLRALDRRGAHAPRRGQYLDLLRLLGRWHERAGRGARRRAGAPRRGAQPRRG